MGNQQGAGVLIAASQPSLRTGLKMFLNEQSSMYAVAEVGDSHELLKKIESTCPDVILLVWDLLDRATLILIKTIKTLDRISTLIILSTEPDHQQATLVAGADAFVNIGDPPGEL